MKTKKSLTIILSFFIIFTLCSCNKDKNVEDSTEFISSDTTIVYVTKTGKKYHKRTCSYLSESKIEMSLEKAQEDGYTRCSRCKPPKE